uniref:Pyroglutamyl-peptidase I n=1 Tax=Meloidogyne floridensis TaxID=298350 RepID=A0A915PDQ5_9BILA
MFINFNNYFDMFLLKFMSKIWMKIAVTGFGPFGDYSTNPSSVVVNGLKDDFNFEGIELITRIVDVDYVEAKKCSEWACSEGSDFVVHVGVQPTPGKLMIESKSFKDGYISPDINGSVPLMNCCKPGTEEDSELDTCICCDDVRQFVLDSLSLEELPLEIQVSNNPGRYLCAYIFYCSLFATRGRSLFVHIPPFDDECTAELLILVLKQILIAIYKLYLNQNVNMGKRKHQHHHEDDEALGDSEASVAASSSTNRNDDFFVSPPLKWSKREISSIDGDNIGINGTSEHFPTKLNGHIQENEIKKAIWLVRKPKNMPIEQLNGLRFSRKPKYSTQEFLMENDGNETSTKFECRLARPTCAMLHATSEETSNQKPKMIPGNFIRGTAWIGEILSMESCTNSTSAATTSSEMSFLTGIDEFQDPEINKIQFHSIRRKPRLNLKKLKERLKPHGCLKFC